MKKMLAKAVALSLVLGGVGFVANDALAAEIGSAVDVETIYGDWDKVLSYNDGQAINAEVATNKANIDTNKANIAKNAENISANQEAIDKEVKDRQDAITQERNARTVAELNLGEQITQEKNAREEADNQLGEGIKANKEAIKTEEQARKYDSLILGDKITQEKNARIDADKAEAAAREDADKKLNAKIDSNAAKVQEQLDAQDGKNKAQDASIKANGQAIAANKDAIKANADAIKANKAEADEQHKYLNSRTENNTANIDKNKVAIENEVKDRKDADKKLQDNIDAEATARKDADTKLQNNIDAEATARKDADTKLQANIEKETADRIAGDNVLNSRINQVESDANKGIAKASALAALHPLDYDPDNKFDIAAAGGFYKGENAFALGAFYRPNRNVMLSMGTTLTSGDNAYNVGVTFKIGKSGKHTETGLTTADLYAMIGAMQDKMDQQQKKIEELEAKQAK